MASVRAAYCAAGTCRSTSSWIGASAPSSRRSASSAPAFRTVKELRERSDCGPRVPHASRARLGAGWRKALAAR